MSCLSHRQCHGWARTATACSALAVGCGQMASARDAVLRACGGRATTEAVQRVSSPVLSVASRHPGPGGLSGFGAPAAEGGGECLDDEQSAAAFVFVGRGVPGGRGEGGGASVADGYQQAVGVEGQVEFCRSSGGVAFGVGDQFGDYDQGVVDQRAGQAPVGECGFGVAAGCGCGAVGPEEREAAGLNAEVGSEPLGDYGLGRDVHGCYPASREGWCSVACRCARWSIGVSRPAGR